MSAPQRPPQLLLIDDDVKLTRLLTGYLHEQGYSVTPAHDGPSGLALAAGGGWDLVVLDGMLPGLDGLEVLKRLRETSRVPVLMLTARGDEGDRVMGLDQGADDYLPKTVSPRELTARIRALLRRAAPAEPPSRLLDFGGLQLDLDGRSVRLGGTELALTPVEFDLLAELARHAGRLRSREQLVEGLRDRRFDANDRSVDVHITALRRKLGDDPREPRYIRTVRGAGYLLQKPDSR
ncbi:DNA-binding response regulator [Solimonas sp. K1W22B-7]|uniref:response regulator transcription factor n=1 Tax=Solimonas sp. K1W22B-7 TaxID=2303331 RepID=UPI000E3311B2|nr:response regulator transcription factor [Solimonas sp. K1W22B-7]AXQ28702.1 DNA-binding response regulator [Solimonas sp. K1W22B-7]